MLQAAMLATHILNSCLQRNGRTGNLDPAIRSLPETNTFHAEDVEDDLRSAWVEHAVIRSLPETHAVHAENEEEDVEEGDDSSATSIDSDDGKSACRACNCGVFRGSIECVRVSRPRSRNRAGRIRVVSCPLSRSGAGFRRGVVSSERGRGCAVPQGVLLVCPRGFW
jgi:hypothetical protein